MKFRSILYGSGKAGNIVGAKGYNNEYTIRVHVPHIHNPNTLPQQIQRQKAKVVLSGLAPLSAVFKLTLAAAASGKRSPWSEAIRLNLAEAVTGEFPNQELDYTKVLVSYGPVDLPYSPSASAEGNSVTVTWSDNSGMGNALADDKIGILAYNPTKKQCVYNNEIADRAERNATLALPTAWSGDTVNVYLWVNGSKNDSRPSGNNYSISTHLAALPL